MSREEISKPTTSSEGGRANESSPADNDDVLLRALRELPMHASHPSPERRIKAEARAAFLRAHENEPWYAKIFGSAGRAVVPAVLASVVGLYLFWAFAAAISLNQ